MKKDLRSSKQIIKALSIGISATMLLQPISAFADDTSAADKLHTVGLNGDESITNSTVAAEVRAAENADKAAYEAEQAAEKATELAEELVEKVEGKDKTETEEAVDGILDKDNNKDGLTLEENVEEAKEAVSDANDAVDNLQTEVDAALDVIAEEATNDVSANVTATETAYDNADKAEDAARLALETLSGNDSIVYKEDAMVEVNKAIEAANTADQEAKKAETALTEAQERYNKAVEDYEALLAQADVSRNEIEKSVSDNEYAAAQDELAKAKEAMEAAKAAYDTALANVGTAEANAQTAFEKAGIADENADAVVDYLTTVKGTESYETLKQKLANAQAKYDGEDLTRKQAQDLSDEYARNIGEAQAEMNRQSANMTNASNTINNWSLNNQANGGIKEVKDHYWINEYHVDGFFSGHYEWREVTALEYYGRFLKFDKEIRQENIYYNETEQQAARNAINQARLNYSEAETAYNNASSAKTTAEDNKKITDEIVSAHDSLELIEKYIYSSDADTTYEDKAKNSEYDQLISDIEREYKQYVEINTDLKKYNDAVNNRNWGVIRWLKDKFTEVGIEAKYIDWNWKIENDKETHIILATNSSNLNFLISVDQGKLKMTSIEEAEFATFSATFDAVAAAQAAKKAADAAEAEKDALQKYNAAVARLSTLQAEVDALQVKALTNDAVVDELDAAYRRLASAFAMVNQASQNYNDAKDEAKKAKEAADEAQKIADSKASRPTPAPSDDDDDDYVVPTSEETTPAPIQTVVLPQGGVTVAQTPITVVDEATPQAAAPVTIKEEAAPKAAAPEVAETKEDIPEEDVPLAAADQSKMNWWWLLVVLVLGTTGAELYRRHMIKKNADSAKTTK
jgi:hypothetical protein